jgi:transcriptional regulator with XRE-family HTH domain
MEHTLAQRLKHARTEAKLTQQQLAKLSGVSQSDISKIEKGKIKSTPSVIPLALALRIDPVVLQTGEQTDRKEIREPSTLLSAVTEIPLLNKENAGMYQEFLNGLPPPATHNYHSSKTDGLFAYSVEDDLMEPKIPKGCKAIINTRTKPAHGMFVLIHDGSTAYIRRLVVDGPAMLANSPHTSRPLTGSIIGVVQELAIWLHDLTGEET